MSKFRIVCLVGLLVSQAGLVISMEVSRQHRKEQWAQIDALNAQTLKSLEDTHSKLCQLAKQMSAPDPADCP